MRHAINFLFGSQHNWTFGLLAGWLLLSAHTYAENITPALEQEPDTVAVTRTVAGILRYARWPNSPASFNLCITGQARYASLLLQESQLAPDWSSSVMAASNTQQLISTCQALYLGELDSATESRLFAQIQDQPILTISEDNPSCTLGSMFCLQTDNGSTSFQINLDSVARSGVRIHPQVLLLGKPKEPTQ